MLILFFDQDVVGNPPCCKCSSDCIGLYPLSILKRFDQVFFRHPCNLTYFVAKRFSQKVMVLIDEYEAPNNRAYDNGYFDKVRSLIPLYDRWG